MFKLWHVFVCTDGVFDKQFLEAIATDYSSFTIEKACKGFDGTFKVSVKSSEAKYDLFYSEAGVLLKTETRRLNKLKKKKAGDYIKCVRLLKNGTPLPLDCGRVFFKLPEPGGSDDF